MAKHFLLLFTTWFLGACAYDVHKHMTLEELRDTFHTDNHDLVPEYEVVHIHRIIKRDKRTIDSNSVNGLDDHAYAKFAKTKDGDFSDARADKTDNVGTSLSLSAFGKPFRLNLVPNRGLFKKGGLKIWSVQPNATSQHGVEYVEIADNESIGDVYQDEENEAAVLLRNTDGSDELIVEGSIGVDLVIRPIPSRLKALMPTIHPAVTTEPPKQRPNSNGPNRDEDDEMFLDADGELSAEVAIDTGLPIRRQPLKGQGHQHIVYKRKQQTQDDTYDDYAFMEPDQLSKRYRRSTQNASARKTRDAPYTIYPEILVIVDYDGYRLHGGDNLQIKRYFVSFWNGVDLRYKLLKGPKIRISIAGIIISRGRDATPYLERNRVGRDAIDSAAALTDMGKYLFRERRLPVYDIAVAITKLDMCRRSYPSDSCNRGTAGFAYVGGACVVNKRLEKVNSVAIIEDTGGFSGIIVAAHEVGHLLGAVHDGSPPPSYLGGPGAEKCQWTDGYIMSDLRHTERGFRWSTCSVSSFHHFLNGDTATCLYNAPHEDDSLPRVLPGKLLTLDAQCRRDRGTSACFKDDRVCAQLFCFDAGSGYCVAYRPAAEGSPCGDGQYCLNGRCVAEHENIIPDYSQNTPSYVRRDGSQPIQGRPLYAKNEDNNENTSREVYQQYTTKPPYQTQYQVQDFYKYPTQNSHFSQSTASTYQIYTISTTHSPYAVQNIAARSMSPPPYAYYTTTSQPLPSMTTNPYIGNYYLLKQLTTKNPYNFANFGKSQQTSENPYDLNDGINNNYLKRSYNTASYFMDSSNLRNQTEIINRQG